MSKTCSRCREEKPESAFYKTDRYCKVCHADYNRQRRNEMPDPARPPAPSTALGASILTDRGIPVMPGKNAGMPWVDLVAWGCLPIEVKTARLTRGQNYHFRFTERQQSQGFKGVFLFVMRTAEGDRAFVVPCDHPEIVDGEGRVRYSALCVTPERKSKKARHWDWFKQFENRFDLLEKQRPAVAI